MEIALLIARLFLASIFALAGFTKATDLARSRRTFIEFGVPEKLAGVVGWGLPFVEIAVAVALLPLETAWWGGVAALALMVMFAVGIGVNLLRGRKPDCNCFGQLHSKPVSWTTFGRNLVLAAVAALIVARPGLSAFDWTADLKSGEVAGLVISLVAVLLLAAAVVYLRRILNQQATVLERIEEMKKVIDEDYAEPAPVERADAVPPFEGPLVGAPAPSFSLPAIGGEQVTLDDLLAYGKPVLLMFVSPNCFPCKTLLPFVRVWERDYDDRFTIALLSKGSLEETREQVARYGARHLLLHGEHSVSEDYQTKWTPAAVLISRGGKIASQVSYGDEAIRALVNHIVTGADLEAVKSPNGNNNQTDVGKTLFKIGEPAPAFSLPDLQGEVVNSQDLLNRDTLLLFWDPGCTFCQALSEDIKRWEENPPKGAPRLAIIATGRAEAVKMKSKDFKSLILHDPHFNVGPVFGSNSTPSAILIDGEGRVASSLVVGGPNVLTLAGIRQKTELPIASSF
jgi:peroxiredoxin/uncharacterized membrane protein YphA (DoxX/SURF4 family)